MNKVIGSIIGFAVAVSLPIAAQAADPFFGSWRLDKAKSIIGNDPGVKSKEIVFAPTKDGGLITETLEMLSGNGEKHVSRMRYAVGKFVPQPGPGMDAFSVVKPDDHRMLWTAQLKGQTIAQLQVDLSDDGRHLTFRYLSKAGDPSGAVTKDRYVYDRE